MTKQELLERLKELKRTISNEFHASSDKVDELYYSLVYDIENQHHEGTYN